ncbi:MAG: hypothetical protein SOV43_09720, partial [Selenomonadaceae bacterium]|nr:hypothetical protein [Selenomonadaceae bacterium]
MLAGFPDLLYRLWQPLFYAVEEDGGEGGFLHEGDFAFLTVAGEEDGFVGFGGEAGVFAGD